MKPILYLSFLTLAACGAEHSSKLDFGKTTVAALTAEKGTPLEEKIIPVNDNKILIYENEEKYQVMGDIVTHGFKNPKGSEKTLLFWKHKFKDCETTTKKITEVKGHELPEYEYACPQEGTSIIYAEGSEFVSRVIRYEKK